MISYIPPWHCSHSFELIKRVTIYSSDGTAENFKLPETVDFPRYSIYKCGLCGEERMIWD